MIPAVAARNCRYGLMGHAAAAADLGLRRRAPRLCRVFPRWIVQGEMPPLLLIGADGEPQIANSRIHQNILIGDRLFGAAELRLGSGERQQTVRIVRTDGSPASRASATPPTKPTDRWSAHRPATPLRQCGCAPNRPGSPDYRERCWAVSVPSPPSYALQTRNIRCPGIWRARFWMRRIEVSACDPINSPLFSGVPAYRR